MGGQWAEGGHRGGGTDIFFLVSKVRIYGRVDNDEIHFVFVLLFKKQNEA